MRQLLAVFAVAPLLMANSFVVAQVDETLDARVQAFLDSHAREWRDLNVPAVDGRILHDLIVERGFTQAVEIGTSTGHSTIWIAWALAKTGGKLVTVEIDERRYEQAKRNVTEAGLADQVEFILGNAHEIVPALAGTYDFVFSDADKDWYVNYFDAMYPKLTADACFTAHNVSENRRRGGRRRGTTAYYEHVLQVEDMETFIHPQSRSGVAISCKRQ
jgi:predicted O-methyltransferase YrrM